MLNAVRENVKGLIDDFNAGHFKKIAEKQKALEEMAERAQRYCSVQYDILKQIPTQIRTVKARMNTSSSWDFWTVGISRRRRTRLGEQEIRSLQAKERLALYAIESNQKDIEGNFVEIQTLERVAQESTTRKNPSMPGWISQIIMMFLSALSSIGLFLTQEFAQAVEQMLHAYRHAREIGRMPVRI